MAKTALDLARGLYEQVRVDLDRYMALHVAELGVCEQYCDVVAALRERLANARQERDEARATIADLLHVRRNSIGWEVVAQQAERLLGRDGSAGEEEER